MDSMYTLDGARICVATMHKKEQAIIPVVEEWYTAIDRHIPLLDTDQFGTFSGEIKRVGDMLQTATIKAKYGLSLDPCSEISIATEGSFSSIFPGIVSHKECVVLRDSRYNYLFSTLYSTTFASCVLLTDNWYEAKEYIEQHIKFPDEGVLIFPEKHKKIFSFALKKCKGMHKGVIDIAHAEYAFAKAKELAVGGMVRIDPDFRALFHPVRMQQIGLATKQLMKQISTSCVNCAMPGRSRVGYDGSATCRFCGSPTLYPTHDVWGCIACSHTERIAVDTSNLPLDSCGICNP